LAKRRQDVERLKGRRDRLAAELADVEERLEGLRGKAPATPSRSVRGASRTAGKRRPYRRRGGTMREAIINVLRDAAGPLRANQIADRVAATGYRTESKNLKLQVQKYLPETPEAKRVGWGVYQFQATS
jgi:hypothetical protein